MRLISDVEAKLVAGGGFLASDSFDGSNGMCWGIEFQDTCDMPTVEISYPTIEDPNWTNVWTAVGALGAILVGVASAPAIAAVGAAVAIGAAIGLANTR